MQVGKRHLLNQTLFTKFIVDEHENLTYFAVLVEASIHACFGASVPKRITPET